MDKNIVPNWMVCYIHKVLINKSTSLWEPLLMGRARIPVLNDIFDQECG